MYEVDCSEKIIDYWIYYSKWIEDTTFVISNNNTFMLSTHSIITEREIESWILIFYPLLILFDDLFQCFVELKNKWDKNG